MSKPRDGVWSILLHLDYVLETSSIHSMKGVTLFIKSWRAQLSYHLKVACSKYS